MKVRTWASHLGLCLATAAAGLFLPATAQQWVAPRTPDGHPDLQGNWTNQTITPVERPRNQPAAVLTPEQVAQREGGVVLRDQRGAAPSDPDRAAPEAGGNVGKRIVRVAE